MKRGPARGRSAAVRYGIVLLAAAFGHCHARRVVRRWDTSQGVFLVSRPAVIAVANPGAWSGGIESDQLRGFLDDLQVAAETLEPAGYSVAVSFRDTIRITNPATAYAVPGRRWDAPVGYYFVAPGRPPEFVAGALNSNQLLLAFRGWQRAEPAAGGPPGPSPTALASAGTLVLPLDSFPELPPPARHALDTLGCRIPELRTTVGSAVVQGRFARSDQTDWAVLCVRGAQMMVVVVWGQATPCPETLVETVGPVSAEIGLKVDRSGYADEPDPRSGTAAAPERYHDGIWIVSERRRDGWICQGGQWQMPSEPPD